MAFALVITSICLLYTLVKLRSLNSLLARSPAPLLDLEQLGKSDRTASARTTLTSSSLDRLHVLLKENLQYQQLINNIAAAVVIRDLGNNIVFASPYTEVLTGFPLVELYGNTQNGFDKQIHQADLKRFYQALKVSCSGEAFYCKFRFYHQSGFMMWGENRSMPYYSKTGEVVGTLSVIIDVTASVRYQQQVEETNRDLQDFTFMVSHDLKSPIFSIKGLLQILREDLGPNIGEDIKKLFVDLESASAKLEALVSSVLEYAKINAKEVRIEAVDLNDFFASLFKEFSQQLSAKNGSFEITRNLPRIQTDELKLNQIFANLLSNSLKYSCPQRAPRIKIELDSSTSERDLVIAFKDNGLGIPEEKLDQAFRPFQRFHESVAPGSGIGLACVRRLAEKLGGGVRILSSTPDGTTFLVSLPFNIN